MRSVAGLIVAAILAVVGFLFWREWSARQATAALVTADATALADSTNPAKEASAWVDVAHSGVDLVDSLIGLTWSGEGKDSLNA